MSVIAAAACMGVMHTVAVYHFAMKGAEEWQQENPFQYKFCTEKEKKSELFY